MSELNTYEVILSKALDTVYRVKATSEESAVEEADQKYLAGEEPLYSHASDQGHRVRLVEAAQPPARRPHRKKRDYLTTAEAADELRVSTWTVGRWINNGTIQATKLGRQYRVPRTEVERLLREGK